MTRRRLLAANWKMYKTVGESLAWARELCRQAEAEPWPADRDVVVCPTLPALAGLAQRLTAVHVAVGAQNLDPGREGALTGAVSGYLLREAGARYVLVGHSERRRHFGETDLMVADKVESAIAAGLIPIVCVGETAAERERGDTEAVIHRQVGAVLGQLATPYAALVVAYEPVWAIGSGQAPHPAEANEVAAAVRRDVTEAWGDAGRTLRVLYGGSVNAGNLGAFWAEPDIDGALVGGASLDVRQFLAMARLPG